jgi:glycosyltransferase involved in cell wall biosynthesis
MKTVSVYIPTRNRPEFLKRALDSLVKQQHKAFQVLVCDDGSSAENKPRVAAVIEEYRQRFSDLVFFNEPESRGACHARNRMIEAADGNYITGLDDDDEFLPNRLRVFLESRQLDRYAYLSAGKIVDDGNTSFESIETRGEITLDKLLHSNIAGNQVFTRTEHLRAVGGFDERFTSWQDYDLWVRLTQAFGPGYKIEKSTYLWHIGHELGRISNPAKVSAGYHQFLEKHGSLLSRRHRQALAVQDRVQSELPLTLGFALANMNTRTCYPLTKHLARSQFPAFFLLLRNLMRPTSGSKA